MSMHQGMYLGLILLGPSGQTLESTHGWNEVRTLGSFETSLTVKNTRGDYYYQKWLVLNPVVCLTKQYFRAKPVIKLVKEFLEKSPTSSYKVFHKVLPVCSHSAVLVGN